MKLKKSERKKALLKASQEYDTLVDPQDETTQETQDQTKEGQDDAQDDRYDSDAEIVDPRGEKEISKEDEVVVVEKKKSDKQEQKKATKELDPPQKVKDKSKSGEKKLPYPD